jgi:hypothetical protein
MHEQPPEPQASIYPDLVPAAEQPIMDAEVVVDEAPAPHAVEVYNPDIIDAELVSSDEYQHIRQRRRNVGRTALSDIKLLDMPLDEVMGMAFQHVLAVTSARVNRPTPAEIQKDEAAAQRERDVASIRAAALALPLKATPQDLLTHYDKLYVQAEENGEPSKRLDDLARRRQLAEELYAGQGEDAKRPIMFV